MFKNKKEYGDDPNTSYKGDAYLNSKIKEKNYSVKSTTSVKKVLAMDTNNLIIVSGSGPSGLIAALACKRQNPKRNVVVCEKRLEYTRRNVAITKVDAYPFLKKMGILPDLIKKSDRLNSKTVGRTTTTDKKPQLEVMSREELENVSKISQINEDVEYDKELMKNDNTFLTDGRVIRICDLQEIILEHCNKADIKILKKTEVTISYEEELEEATVSLKKKGIERSIINPYKIIIAEGASSHNTVRVTGGWNYGIRNELWAVANIEAKTDQSFVGIVRPQKQRNQSNKTLMGLFTPSNQEMSLTECFHVASKTKKMNAHDLCLKDTSLMGDLFNVETERLKWNSSFFQVQDKIAKKHLVDNRIMIIGDAAGTSSPIAGMGVSVSVSAHGWAVMRYMEECEDRNPKAADNFCEHMKAYVMRWHRNSHLVWDRLDNVLLNDQAKDQISLGSKKSRPSSYSIQSDDALSINSNNSYVMEITTEDNGLY